MNMTLKTGIMMLHIQLCLTGINCILIENSYFKLQSYFTILLYFNCIFYQINAAMVRKIDMFGRHIIVMLNYRCDFTMRGYARQTFYCDFTMLLTSTGLTEIVHPKIQICHHLFNCTLFQICFIFEWTVPLNEAKTLSTKKMQMNTQRLFLIGWFVNWLKKCKLWLFSAL